MCLFCKLQPPNFPEFESALKTSIKKLGGKVFPKLNWSSPKVIKIHSAHTFSIPFIYKKTLSKHFC